MYQVRCVTKPTEQVFWLSRRMNWTHSSNTGVELAKFETRTAARSALGKAYKHKADVHEVVPVREG